MNVVFLTNDLMFSSRVLGAATTFGLTLKIAPTAPAVVQSVTEQTQLVLVDLTLAGVDLAGLVENIRAKSAAAKIVAFGPHVDELLLSNASLAGCDGVLTRSQFQQRYVDMLKTCLA